MSGTKVGKWINNNIVFLVGIPLIIGIHYGWSKLQENPHLVPPEERKEQPLVAASISEIMFDIFCTKRNFEVTASIQEKIGQAQEKGCYVSWYQLSNTIQVWKNKK